jgi:hypothetical protein
MTRIPILAILLGVGATVGFAQSEDPANEPPKQVVEEFCKMSADGAWLSPEGWNRLRELLTDGGTWSPPRPISVLKGYHVGDAARHVGYKGIVEYQVEVDYFEWGEVDAFLNFNLARDSEGKSASAEEPIEQRLYEPLYLSGKQWKIAVPGAPTAGIDAVLPWVIEVRDKSGDPAVRYNAQTQVRTRCGDVIFVTQQKRTRLRIPAQSPFSLTPNEPYK